MNLCKTNSRFHKSTLMRVGNSVCASLGLFWAVSPLLHGVFHVAEVSHRHPTGSVHDHHHHHHHGHSHSHDDSEPQEDRQDRPIPPDDNSSVVFYSLEIQSTDNVAIDTQLSAAAPPRVEEVSQCVGFYSLASIGVAAPRGPPA